MVAPSTSCLEKSLSVPVYALSFPYLTLPRPFSPFRVIYREQRTVEMLCDPNARCTSVMGEPGSGKTQIALKACEYVLNRHRFDKMFKVPCKDAVKSTRLHSGEHEDQIAYLCRLVGINSIRRAVCLVRRIIIAAIARWVA